MTQNQNPPPRLDVLDHSNLLARASNCSQNVLKRLRSSAPSADDLKAACTSANIAAQSLNRLCSEFALGHKRKVGAIRIEQLEAENKKQRAALQVVADFIAGKPDAIEPFQLVRDALATKGGEA